MSVALRQHPRERELRRRDVLLGRDLGDGGRELGVAAGVLALEARLRAAPVVRVELVRRREAPGKVATAERRVGDQADPERAQRRQDGVLDLAGNSENPLWTAAIGWTAWAARIVSGDASLSRR